MQEISLNILDIAQNSIRANATLIEIIIEENPETDLFAFTIKDNGCGMDAEMVKTVSDPFVTTRTTRKVGLGISLLKSAAQQTGGDIKLESELVFSSDVPEGEIISQFPYAGARRKVADGEEYTVTLTVSAGKEENRLPSLEGYKYPSAAAILRSMGAEIRIVSVYDDEKESDVVLYTSPKSGVDIERGDTVTLFVSRNHIHGSVKVKSVVGLPLDIAATELLAQGLTLGEIKQEYSDEYEAGTVISQSVREGSYVLHGSAVDLTVSAGKKIERLHPFRGDITEENGEINESVD